MSDPIYGTVPASTHDALQREWMVQRNRADAAESRLAEPLRTAAVELENHATECEAVYDASYAGVEGCLHRMGSAATAAGFRARHFRDAAAWLRERHKC